MSFLPLIEILIFVSALKKKKQKSVLLKNLCVVAGQQAFHCRAAVLLLNKCMSAVMAAPEVTSLPLAAGCSGR